MSNYQRVNRVTYKAFARHYAVKLWESTRLYRTMHYCYNSLSFAIDVIRSYGKKGMSTILGLQAFSVITLIKLLRRCKAVMAQQ